MEGPDPGADAGLVPGQAVLGEVDGDLDRPSLGPALQAGGRRAGPPSQRRFEAGGDFHPLGRPGDAFVGRRPVLDGHLRERLIGAGWAGQEGQRPAEAAVEGVGDGEGLLRAGPFVEEDSPSPRVVTGPAPDRQDDRRSL